MTASHTARKSWSRRLRPIPRQTHIVAGVLVGASLYSSLGESDAYTLFVQVAAAPVLVVTGLSMWQRARLQRRIGGARSTVK